MISAQTLSTRRTSLGLSQRRLALLVGLNYQVIRRLEAGGDDSNLALRDLGKLCAALGVTPVELLSGASGAADAADLGKPSPRELDVTQARLLWRIQQGAEVRRSLSRTDRELILPSLIKLDLAEVRRGGQIAASALARENLDMVPT